MHFPHELFKKAGLNSTDVANLFCVSRITGYRWLKGTDRNGAEGVGVNIFLRPAVTKIARRLEAAVTAGALPNEALAKLPPTKRAAKIKSIIVKHRPQN